MFILQTMNLSTPGLGARIYNNNEGTKNLDIISFIQNEVINVFNFTDTTTEDVISDVQFNVEPILGLFIVYHLHDTITPFGESYRRKYPIPTNPLICNIRGTLSTDLINLGEPKTVTSLITSKRSTIIV